MRVVETMVYTVSELKNLFPDSYEKAFERYQKDCDNDGEIPWQRETFNSLKGLCEAASVKMLDWSLGVCNRNNHVDVTFNREETGELSGKRAFAWLENNLFGALRISYSGKERWRLSKFNKSYVNVSDRRPYTAGMIQLCPFTGYFADEEYMDDLRKAVKEGDTLKEAFEGLANTCERMLEQEIKHQKSEEEFTIRADFEDWMFEEDGTRFN